MYKKSFEISNHPNSTSFERVRWHVLNYILRQGIVSIRSPLPEGRMRPGVDSEEFAIVSFDQGVYYFYVEPLKKNQTRRLQIGIESSSLDDLSKRALELTKATDLIELNPKTSH